MVNRLTWLGFGVLLSCGGRVPAEQGEAGSGSGESGADSSSTTTDVDAESGPSTESSSATEEDTSSSDGGADTGQVNPLGIPYCATASESLDELSLPIRAAGDLDGDGVLDLVVGGSDAQAAWLGDGFGGFAPGKGALAPGGGRSLVADVDGDGRADLLRYDFLSDANDVAVHLSDGTGFAEGVESNFDSLFYHASAHDFDGDGNEDMLVGGFHSTPARVFRSLGDGTFEQAHELAPIACYVLSADVADLDGDGDLDVAITGGCNSSIEEPSAAVFVQSQGVFAEAVGYPTDNWDPPFVRFGELDGDGIPDMFVQGWHQEARFATHRGVGDGSFEERVEQSVDVVGDPDSLRILDADGDGLSDLLQQVDSHVVLHRNTGVAFSSCYWVEAALAATGDFTDHLGDEVVVEGAGARLTWLVD